MVITLTEDDAGVKIVAQPEIETTREIAREISRKTDSKVMLEVNGPRDDALRYAILGPHRVLVTIDPYVPEQGYELNDVIEDINKGFEQVREMEGE